MAATKKIPVRTCIGCGENGTKKEMTRIIRTTEGEIQLDTTGRKNGRGAYIHAKEECLTKAVKSHGLERAFKMPIPKEIYENLKAEMEENYAE